MTSIREEFVGPNTGLYKNTLAQYGSQAANRKTKLFSFLHFCCTHPSEVISTLPDSVLMVIIDMVSFQGFCSNLGY
jgi:hypothetical protein